MKWMLGFGMLWVGMDASACAMPSKPLMQLDDLMAEVDEAKPSPEVTGASTAPEAEAKPEAKPAQKAAAVPTPNAAPVKPIVAKPKPAGAALGVRSGS